jgi:hypothetical protein
MKFTLLIIGVFAMCISCSDMSTNREEDVAIVKKYIDAVESKNYEVMADLLDESYLGLGPSIYDSIGREAALNSWQENIENLYESIEYQRSQTAPIHIAEGENQGDWIANFAQLKITYQGNKKSIIIWANTNYRIEKGKIVKSYTIYNEADALRQLGYVFINPNEL